MLLQYGIIRDKLGPAGASARIAAAMLEELKGQWQETDKGIDKGFTGS